MRGFCGQTGKYCSVNVGTFWNRLISRKHLKYRVRLFIWLLYYGLKIFALTPVADVT
jgi:hypothetical protein